MTISNVEVTVTITVPAGDMWMYKLHDALKNVGNAICMNPEFNEGKGESTTYTFEYYMKGVE
jgi:hypothetical protein